MDDVELFCPGRVEFSFNEDFTALTDSALVSHPTENHPSTVSSRVYEAMSEEVLTHKSLKIPINVNLSYQTHHINIFQY